MKSLHINNNLKPLIIVGTSANLTKVLDVCDLVGITVTGIVDNDYYGNTETFAGIGVIDCLDNIKNYQATHNFFCAINWVPFDDAISVRNKNKRIDYIKKINELNIKCISLVDPLARVASSATIGYGVFIDAFVLVETEAVVGDFVSIYSYTGIGHHTTIGQNTVFQRHCSIAGECIFEENVFVGTAVKALKTGATFGSNTFIHEGIYIRRGTIPDEVVSMQSNNLSRIYDMATVSQLL
jgi:serine acetyltransferase